MSQIHSEDTQYHHFAQFRVCIIKVRAGESNQDAWERHIRLYPDDNDAIIKIFHHPHLQAAKPIAPAQGEGDVPAGPIMPAASLLPALRHRAPGN